ncbi:hypothetical protein GCM10027162_57230 [Streptomyces incanus]
MDRNPVRPGFRRRDARDGSPPETVTEADRAGFRSRSPVPVSGPWPRPPTPVSGPGSRPDKRLVPVRWRSGT